MNPRLAEGSWGAECCKLNPLPIATRPLNSLKGTFAFQRDVSKLSFELAVDMKRGTEI